MRYLIDETLVETEATELDVRLLRGLLGGERMQSLLAVAGAYDGGPHELVEIDDLGHAAWWKRAEPLGTRHRRRWRWP